MAAIGPILLKNSPVSDGLPEFVDESSILIVQSTKFRQNLIKFEASANCSEFFNGIGPKADIRLDVSVIGVSTLARLPATINSPANTDEIARLPASRLLRLSF